MPENRAAMKYKIFLPLVLFIFSFNAFAQLSSRATDSTTFQLGNRPVAGTKAVMIGAKLGLDSSLTVVDVFDGMAFKYFKTSNLAFRVRFDVDKTTTTTRGDVDTTGSSDTVTYRRTRMSDRQYILSPGAEYHFGYNNVFDVYVAGDLQFGFEREVRIENEEYVAGSYNNLKQTTPSTLLGLAPSVGINFWIADLPLSLGLEYQTSLLWQFGGKTRVVNEVKTGNDVVVQEYYTQDQDAFGNADDDGYSRLSRRYFETNQYLRFILTFYVK